MPQNSDIKMVIILFFLSNTKRTGYRLLPTSARSVTLTRRGVSEVIYTDMVLDYKVVQASQKWYKRKNMVRGWALRDVQPGQNLHIYTPAWSWTLKDMLAGQNLYTSTWSWTNGSGCWADWIYTKKVLDTKSCKGWAELIYTNIVLDSELIYANSVPDSEVNWLNLI